MAQFLQVSAWYRQMEKSYDATINLEHVISIVPDDEGRANILMAGSGIVLTSQLYGDFVAMLKTKKAE